MPRVHQQPLNTLSVLGSNFFVSAVSATRFSSIFVVFLNAQWQWHKLSVSRLSWNNCTKLSFRSSQRHFQDWAMTALNCSLIRSLIFCSFLSSDQVSLLCTLKKNWWTFWAHNFFVHPPEILLGGDYKTRYHNSLPQQMFVERKPNSFHWMTFWWKWFYLLMQLFLSAWNTNNFWVSFRSPDFCSMDSSWQWTGTLQLMWMPNFLQMQPISLSQFSCIFMKWNPSFPLASEQLSIRLDASIGASKVYCHGWRKTADWLMLLWLLQACT